VFSIELESFLEGPMSYYSLVLARTFKETTKIWNVHRFWAALAVPLSGAILRVGTRGLVAIGWREILVFAVFGFATCWVGSYLINLLRVPAILHDEQAAVIDALTAPPLSPQEQRRIEIVRRKLEAFPEKEKAVLQYIWEHGSVNTHTLPYSELDGSAAPEALRKGVRQGLLVMTSDAMSHSMIDQAIATREWRIHPDLESSFTHLFTQNLPKDSLSA
jgi:hypothetical protein